MNRTLVLAVSAWLALGFQPAPAAQRSDSPRDCRDDRGVDRCAADQQRRVRELYGVRSIEAHQAAGDQVRRAFYVDGYGRDLIAIAFVRAPGREPAAWVHFPRREGEPPAEALQASVPKPVWDEVLDRSWLFDRALAQVEAKDGPIICMHSWVYTIEATDLPDPGANARPKPPRSKTGDACWDDLVQDYAVHLSRSAIALFPACAALDPELHRNDAARLAACGILRGDRLAAAEVLNRLETFRRARRADESILLAGMFTSDAAIDWSGSTGRGRTPPLDFWLARLQEAGTPPLYVESVEGITSRRVRVRAILVRTEERPDGERRLRSAVEQIWVFTPAQLYQLESVRVGPFEAAP